MTAYRVCAERIPKADGLLWLLGWKWEWWLEDDLQGSWSYTYNDPYKSWGVGRHPARSKEKAIAEGKGAIAAIRKKEDKKYREREARAATHECVSETDE